MRNQLDKTVFSEFNLAKGRNFKLQLDPKDSVFYMLIGSSKIYLKALLDAIDADEAAFRRAVGNEYFDANWTNIPEHK